MKSVSLSDGTEVPALGLGTWRMGESRATHDDEVRAVERALEIGYRLIDTAEMYGDGGAERVVGEAIEGALLASLVKREELFLVSKVWPHNATRAGTVAACERSLLRMRVDYLDMYLLHWPSNHPLEETIDAFEALRGQGKIMHWGVSNFDIDAMQALAAIETPRHRRPACATNQLYYSLGERGIEFSLLPWMRAQRMPLMAYRPTDKAALAANTELKAIAKRHEASAVQIALAWLIGQRDVIAIPKAVKEAHLLENWDAQRIALSETDLRALDTAFAPPRRKTPLAIR